MSPVGYRIQHRFTPGRTLSSHAGFGETPWCAYRVLVPVLAWPPAAVLHRADWMSRVCGNRVVWVAQVAPGGWDLCRRQ